MEGSKRPTIDYLVFGSPGDGSYISLGTQSAVSADAAIRQAAESLVAAGADVPKKLSAVPVRYWTSKAVSAKTEVVVTID